MLKDLSYEPVDRLEQITKAWWWSKWHDLGTIKATIEQAKWKKILEEAQGVCYD